MPIINALFVPIRGLSHTIVSAYGIQTGMESRQDFAVKATAASPADYQSFTAEYAELEVSFISGSAY